MAEDLLKRLVAGDTIEFGRLAPGTVLTRELIDAIVRDRLSGETAKLWMEPSVIGTTVKSIDGDVRVEAVRHEDFYKK